jgi:hypothetical protein
MLKITLENTTKIVELNGVTCRIWEGHTESGIPVHCFIARVAAHQDEDQRELAIALSAQRQPSPAIEAYPLRMVI